MTVQNTRVGQVTDYDKLTLDVWTKGTLLPDEAVSLAAKVLSEHLKLSLIHISFTRMSVFALSITPYITSSIIMQLLTIAIPKLEEMQKEGAEGRKKIAAITRYVTVALALIESTAMAVGFGRAVFRVFLFSLLIFSSFLPGVLFTLAAQHGVTALLFDTILRLPEQQQPSRALKIRCLRER